MPIEISSNGLSQTQNTFKDLISKLTEYTSSEIETVLQKTSSLKQVSSYDLNAIIDPGFYFISEKELYRNLPGTTKIYDSQAGILLVYTDFQDSTKFIEDSSKENVCIQLFINSLNGAAYIRTSTLNSNEAVIDIEQHDTEPEDSWTSWVSFLNTNKYFANESTLPNGTNLDSVRKSGYYYLSTTKTYINSPLPETEGGLLIVHNDLNFSGEASTSTDRRLFQTIVRNGDFKILTRSSISSSTFSTWTSIAKEADVDSKIDKYVGLHKYDLLDYEAGNLFDGNWIEDLNLAGDTLDDTNLLLREQPGFKFLGIVAIKPNTKYTVLHANPIVEEYWADASKSFCYFGVATATHLLKAGERLDGDVSLKKTGTPTKRYNFSTGPNDQYLYIQGGYQYNGQPAPYVKVVEGEVTTNIANKTAEDYTPADQATFKLKDQYAPKLTTNIVNNNIFIDGTAKQNLFNGFYCKGLWLGGAVASSTISASKGIIGYTPNGFGLKYMADDNYKGTFIVQVKENTVYSIIKESTGLEYISGDYHSVLKVLQTTADVTSLFEILGAQGEIAIDSLNTQIASINKAIYLGEHIDSDGNIIDEGAKNYESVPASGVVSNITGESTNPQIEYLPCIASYTGTGRDNLIIKTGKGVKYLIVSVGKEIQPFVQVVEGKQENFTVSSYDEVNSQSAPTHRTSATRRTRGLLNFYKWYDTNKYTRSSTTSKFSNDACPTITITNGRNSYTFVHANETFNGKSKPSIDTWRWWKHELDGELVLRKKTSGSVLWSGSDCEGAIKIKDNPDFLGGYHKGERILANGLKILIDGKPLEILADSTLTTASSTVEDLDKICMIKHGCKNITLIVESEIYLHDANSWAEPKDITLAKAGLPIFLRTKKIEITNTKVKVSNTWKALQAAAGLTVTRSVLAGLYSVNKNYLNGLTDNVSKKFYQMYKPNGEKDENFDKSLKLTALSESRDLDEVTFFGNNDFVLTIRSYTDKEQYGSGTDCKYRGSVMDFDYGYKDNNDDCWQYRLKNGELQKESLTNIVRQNRYKAYFDDISVSSLVLAENSVLTGCFEIETLTDDLNFTEAV